MFIQEAQLVPRMDLPFETNDSADESITEAWNEKQLVVRMKWINLQPLLLKIRSQKQKHLVFSS